MQIIRAIVIIVGMLVSVIGLYLLVIGLGAPIELPIIEVGPLKASASGIGAGAVVSGVGLAMMWLAMDKFKRSVTEGGGTTIVHSKEPMPPETGSGGGGGGGGGGYRHVLQDKVKDRL